jgi:hypothetical protein
VNDGNINRQITKFKWFDKLTTLSRVEGQITITKIQNSNQLSCSTLNAKGFVLGQLVVLVIGYWNLRFICILVLGNCDLTI